ncbi:hypothetical protein [Pseudoalteromonas sp. SWN166]|uniref:hypothetical protein n=1 Tax=Pseudoalteromonas sp. SWN166 TaxID=2792061 RepID=UPI003FA71056
MTFFKWLVVIIAVIICRVYSVNKSLVAHGLENTANIKHFDNGKFHNDAKVEPTTLKKHWD